MSSSPITPTDLFILEISMSNLLDLILLSVANCSRLEYAATVLGSSEPLIVATTIVITDGLKFNILNTACPMSNPKSMNADVMPLTPIFIEFSCHLKIFI